MLNNVASPVKFAEYISCGLIPIISPGVGDYSSLVMNEKIGIVVDENITFDFKDIEEYLNDKNIYDRIYNAAEKLTWDKNLKHFPQ
jgi:glycosyltransferase involved in cell wall biosynthesis